MTLIELVVALAVLGILLAMAGVAFPATSDSPATPIGVGPAVRSGKMTNMADSTGMRVALPDGRGLGPDLDPLFPGRCSSAADTAERSAEDGSADGFCRTPPRDSVANQ